MRVEPEDRDGALQAGTDQRVIRYGKIKTFVRQGVCATQLKATTR